MFISIDNDGIASLQDIDEFKGFEVRSSLDPVRTQVALEAIGRLADEHVWIPIAWIEAHGRPGDAAWHAGLAGMIGFARKKGWVDGDNAVRAHLASCGNSDPVP